MIQVVFLRRWRVGSYRCPPGPWPFCGFVAVGLGFVELRWRRLPWQIFVIESDPTEKLFVHIADDGSVWSERRPGK
jgi:hypothetical protein